MNTVVKVGYLGPKGSFSEEALLDCFQHQTSSKQEASDQTISIEYTHFEDIFTHLSSGDIHYGIFPVENSSTGGITEVSDLLMKYNFYIVGEKKLKIEHYLLAKNAPSISEIQTVYSISHGLRQSKAFMEQSLPNAKIISTSSTAESASIVNSLADAHCGCIASMRASKIYGLSTLAGPINDKCNNYTRFVIVSREKSIPSALIPQDQTDTLPNKISIIFSLPHISGSLYHALGCFAQNQINLLRIESRPTSNTKWEYLFHADFTGNLKDTNVVSALSQLKEIGITYKVLGLYFEEKEKDE